MIRTSLTCDHQVPARSAPASPAPHPEHCAGGGTCTCSSGSGSRDSPAPGCPGCPPRLRSARRSRSEDCRAFRSAVRRSRPDRVLRRRRPRGRAVRPQPPLQLRDPQLQPPVPLPLSPQLRPQHRVLGILGLDHCPQPGDQLALIPAAGRHTRLIGHKPRACSPTAEGSSTRAACRVTCRASRKASARPRRALGRCREIRFAGGLERGRLRSWSRYGAT